MRDFTHQFSSPPDAQNNNEYVTVCGTTVLYDDAGNLIQDKSGYKYAYDGACPGVELAGENRLTQIARPDDTVVATFAGACTGHRSGNALGRRINETGKPGTVTYRKPGTVTY